MRPRTELVSYRLKNGVMINYSIDMDRGLTLEDINNVACLCVEAFMLPSKVFIRADLYSQLMRDIESTRRYSSAPHIGVGIVYFHTLAGDLAPVIISNSYIPILVGDEDDFADNDFYRVFEDAING